MYSSRARLRWRFGGADGSDCSKIGQMHPCVPGTEIIDVSLCTPLACLDGALCICGLTDC